MRVVDDQVHTHESCEEAEAALEAALGEIKRLRQFSIAIP
jgi:hypothetical protein